MTLETMGTADLEAVCCLDRKSFAISWDRRFFESELVIPGALSLVARPSDAENGKAVGAFSCFRILMDEMHLMRIAVDPKYRGNGIGSWLLETTCHKAMAMGAQSALLEVRESNAAAAALYRKAGFACCGRRPNYYPETREAALVMLKNFPRRQYEHENRNQWLWSDRTSSFSGSIG